MTQTIKSQSLTALEGVSEANHKEEVLFKDETLEQLLDTLTAYGEPSIFMNDKKWHCRVNMNTNVAGAAFAVSSELKFKTPHGAAAQCLYRTLEAITSLSQKKKP
jgi:hypothetical protein